jgi:hypothetical protein
MGSSYDILLLIRRRLLFTDGRIGRHFLSFGRRHGCRFAAAATDEPGERDERENEHGRKSVQHEIAFVVK